MSLFWTAVVSIRLSTTSLLTGTVCCIVICSSLVFIGRYRPIKAVYRRSVLPVLAVFIGFVVFIRTANKYTDWLIKWVLEVYNALVTNAEIRRRTQSDRICILVFKCRLQYFGPVVKVQNYWGKNGTSRHEPLLVRVTIYEISGRERLDPKTGGGERRSVASSYYTLTTVSAMWLAPHRRRITTVPSLAAALRRAPPDWKRRRGRSTDTWDLNSRRLTESRWYARLVTYCQRALRSYDHRWWWWW